MENNFLSTNKIEGAYKQAIFREIGAAHSLLGIRKYIHIRNATSLMLEKADKEKINPEYISYLTSPECMQLVSDILYYLDTTGFGKDFSEKFIGTKEHREFKQTEREFFIKVVSRLDNVYPKLLNDDAFSELSTPNGYFFDFFNLLNKPKIHIPEVKS